MEQSGIYYSNINDGGIMMYFENIRPEDIFRQRRNGTGILIDLREYQEYQNGHIPGAVCIPYALLPSKISKLRSWVIQCSRQYGRAVLIVYCDRGNTSLRAARDLYNAGFRVKNVYGGISAYKGPRTRENSQQF